MSPPRCLLPAIMLALSGCASLFHSNAPAVQLYVLQAPADVALAGAPATAPVATPAAAGSTGPTLRVARPLPGPGLNTDRIALLRPGNRLDYYAVSRWSAPLADVVSDLELAALRADPTWSAVADERATLNADYVLQTSIDRFAAEYAQDAGPPRVRVELRCLLVRRHDGVLLGSFAATASQMAQANRMSGVIAAFAAAADRAVSDAAAQAAVLLRSAKPPAAP